MKAHIAGELNQTWEEIEAQLYADVMESQRLEAFQGYADAEAFLSRYNLAQVQACLYRCERMAVTATRDFVTLLRYAKLARLLHEIRRLGPSRYRITLTGPASFLGRTRRYGVNFARFVPALLACTGWRMRAAIQAPWRGAAILDLSSRDGLSSHLPPPEEFDSTVEEAFAKRFGEAEIVWQDQIPFVPDFVFRHEDGTEVLLEIVGFWTPAYLARKRNALRRFLDRRILVAVPERSLRPNAAVPDGVLVCKTKLKLPPVLAALGQARNWR